MHFGNFCSVSQSGVVGYSGDFAETSMDQLGKEEDGLHQDGKEIQLSNMYVRRMDDPRKHFKSFSIRTPFATYNRRKHPH